MSECASSEDNVQNKLENFLDGRYLSLQDNEFVERVTCDIQYFLQNNKANSVLIFPPVSNFRRFLIHKVVEDAFSELSTFSIGQANDRRTVVCFKDQLARQKQMSESHGAVTCLSISSANPMRVDHHLSAGVGSSSTCRDVAAASSSSSISRRAKATPSLNIYRPPPARRAEQKDALPVKNSDAMVASAKEGSSDLMSETKTKSRPRQRRPDIQVYVPRPLRGAERESNSVQRSPSPAPNATSTPIRRVASPAPTPNMPAPPQEHSEELKVRMLGRKDAAVTVKKPCEADGEKDVKDNSNENWEHSESDSPRCLLRSKDGVSSGSDSGRTNMRKSKNDSGFDESIESPCKDSVKCNSVGDKSVSSPQKISENSVESVLELSSESLNFDHESSIVNNFKKTTEFSHSEGIRGTNYVKSMDGTGRDRVSLTKELNESDVQNNVKRTNNKNKIIGGRFSSDVLIISDPKPVLKVLPENKLKSSDTCSLEIQSQETPIKKKKVKHKEDDVKVVKKVNKETEQKARKDEKDSGQQRTDINVDECSWEMLFDENGDCLNPKLLEELTAAVGEVSIEKPKSDYNNYQTKEWVIGDEEFSHVVEIYNFPSEFKTQDLLTVFSPFKNAGFEIKWVDDTHALGVFSSSLAASEVLASQHPFVKTRPLSQATHESRIKARRTAEFLQPYRPRPETCMAMAKRLVTGALGVRLKQSREEREAERKILKEAREKKRLAARQREEAWEGTIGEK